MKRFFYYTILSLLTICTVLASEVITNSEFNKAVKQGDIEFVKQNISKIENIDSEYCFLCSAAEKKQDKILDFLIENNANPDCPKSSISPLYTALVYDNNYAVEKLLKAGANPNNKTNAVPPIYLAIVNDNSFAVSKLLEAGANPNVTFMKVNALTCAFGNNHPEIEEAFINYWNSRFETPSTDINSALKLLENSKNGNKYYKILTGDNKTGKPYKILFCDIEKISQGRIKEKMIERYDRIQKQNYIYYDNDYRNIPPEVLATMLAAESINTDGKSSVIEQLVQLGIMGNIWSEFISNNPEINDMNNSVIKGFNGIINLLNANTGRLTAGDYNNLWMLSGIASTKNKTSKGYKNKDLNTYFK